jgi:hypothetical protein
LGRSRKFGVFAPRLADTAAGSGVCAGEFGEKAVDTDDWRGKKCGGAHLTAVIAGQGLPYVVPIFFEPVTRLQFWNSLHY